MYVVAVVWGWVFTPGFMIALIIISSGWSKVKFAVNAKKGKKLQVQLESSLHKIESENHGLADYQIHNSEGACRIKKLKILDHFSQSFLSYNILDLPSRTFKLNFPEKTGEYLAFSNDIFVRFFAVLNISTVLVL